MGERRYAAFLSYSSVDGRFAKELHRRLENFVLPASLRADTLPGASKKRRIYPVFRDREELPSGNLAPQIEIVSIACALA